jgi:hypothetical protein
LKPFCPIKNVLHVLAPNELVHSFWASHSIYWRLSTNTPSQYSNFPISTSSSFSLYSTYYSQLLPNLMLYIPHHFY